MLLVMAILFAVASTLLFSTLTYSLREFSRARLADQLERAGKSSWLEGTVDHRQDLVFVTACWRLLANLLILLATMRLLHHRDLWMQYASSLAITGILGLLFSVALPHALAQHLGEAVIALFIEFLHGLRLVMSPLTRLLHLVDRLVARVAGASAPQTEQIEQEILSVVEEGEKEGVVDEQEREMIESVIEFRDTQVGQIMTARPQIVALEIHAGLDEVRQTLEQSAHSRVPVYEGTIDHVVGILYARDLIRYLGQNSGIFDLRQATRPAIFVPESKPLRDLLQEFRGQKVHIAIVLDEYGGTAGLVTIEDILEELVGEISDEHEAGEPPMLRRLDGDSFEADARLDVEAANQQIGLNLPTDAGYDTLGGFVSIALGRIPPKGTTFVHENARFTILAAEPQRVNRLRIDLLPAPVGGTGPGGSI
jgi:putative hemolysin